MAQPSDPARRHPVTGTSVGPMVTAMITPFTEDGKLDLDGAQRLSSHLVDQGNDTILVCGTTGESPTLVDNEHWELLHAVKDAIGDRATVMMGTGTNATERTVWAPGRAGEQGADAALVVTPYYNRPDHRGQLAHFSAAAHAADGLPMIVYDVPGRTSKAIEHRTLVELAQIDNIVGVKDAAGDVAKTAEVIRDTRDAPGGFRVWCGADELNLPVLAVGGVGAVSVSGHLVAPELSAMIAAFPDDPARARDLHARCLAVHRAMFLQSSPGPLKGALNAKGLPAGPVRGPIADADPDVVDAVLRALAPVEAAR